MKQQVVCKDFFPPQQGHKKSPDMEDDSKTSFRYGLRRILAGSRGAACASATGLACGRCAPFLVAVSLRMPTSPFQGEATGVGDQFCYFSTAFWALTYRGIGKLPAQFKAVVAGVALVFIDWHW
jgi:hypothetical protein